MAPALRKESPMFGSDTGSRHGRVGAVLVLAMLVYVEEIVAAEPAETADVARSSLLPPIILQAIRGAAVKLAGSACREIFADFRDAAGRTLQQNLEALGVTGEGYLRWTLFYDGQGKGVCASRAVLAATSPGSRAIFVCTAQFSILALRDPGLAADLIIHEELHSLGLGERPPDSKAITAQVIVRCGK